jgi:cyanophycin synthetase
MKFARIQPLRGPNVWANFPVLEVLVELEELDQQPSDEIAGFNQRLTSWLPSLGEHRCSVGRRGGFVERLLAGTSVAHALEHVTIELQSLAGADVGFGKARETADARWHQVVVSYEEETLARACLETARELLLAAVYNRAFDVAGEVQTLRELGDEMLLGPSTRAIVEAAHARGIPIRRLNTASLVQLGHGSRSRRICTAETDNTPAIAETISQDKELTKSLLRAVGVPVPEGRIAHSAEDAWTAAEDIGLPVVVKPRDGNHGRGVFIGLSTREEVVGAFPYADNEGNGVIVEQFVPGIEHRLLVVGGRMVAATRGAQAYVVGDGVHTVAELVDEQLNCDPRRGDDYGTPLSRVEFNAPTRFLLEQQGYQADSIPKPRSRVLMRRNGDLTIDVTDNVHPAVAACAVAAAQVVGLDIAGLDVVAQDIGRPFEEQGGRVVEVNAGPGLQMHLEPAVGRPRPVGEAIMATLFPEGQSGRVPLVAMLRSPDTDVTLRVVAHALMRKKLRVVRTAPQEIWLDQRQIVNKRLGRHDGVEAALMNPSVDAAAFDIGSASIAREGLGFDRCDVAIVTRGGDVAQLGSDLITAPEDAAVVERTLVEAVAPEGFAVLNASDPLSAGMASYCPGMVILVDIQGSTGTDVAVHRKQGGKLVSLVEGRFVLIERERKTPVIELKALGNGASDHPLPIGAAIAALWALRMTPAEMRASLESFAGQAQDLLGAVG